MGKITFRCCKFLDHTDGHFIDCKLVPLHHFGVYWERDSAWTDLCNGARDVQFCSKRGRLNCKTACLEGTGGECSDYKEEERTVTVPD
jgi:hypothetical protein